MLVWISLLGPNGLENGTCLVFNRIWFFFSWFHGKITRQQAEDLLQPRRDGLFLLRESTNYPGDYTMCVCFEDRVEHYRIIFKDNKVTIDEEEYFENLTKLVEVCYITDKHVLYLTILSQYLLDIVMDNFSGNPKITDV